MAFSAGSSGVRGRGRQRTSYGAMAEMNVVPLVDVVLVLLIIFMLTAHIQEFGMQVNVPKVAKVSEAAEDLPAVNISKAGKIELGNQSVNINLLVAEIKKRYPKADTVYIRADEDVKYGLPVRVMNMVGQGGYKLTLVYKPDQ